jgi:hypothetical protein
MSAGLLTKRTTFRGRGFWAVFTSIGLLLAFAFSLLEPIRPYYDFAAPISLLSADYAEHLPLSDDVTMAASATPIHQSRMRHGSPNCSTWTLNLPVGGRCQKNGVERSSTSRMILKLWRDGTRMSPALPLQKD